MSPTAPVDGFTVPGLKLPTVWKLITAIRYLARVWSRSAIRATFVLNSLVTPEFSKSLAIVSRATRVRSVCCAWLSELLMLPRASGRANAESGLLNMATMACETASRALAIGVVTSAGRTRKSLSLSRQTVSSSRSGVSFSQSFWEPLASALKRRMADSVRGR